MSSTASDTASINTEASSNQKNDNQGANAPRPSTESTKVAEENRRGLSSSSSSGNNDNNIGDSTAFLDQFEMDMEPQTADSEGGDAPASSSPPVPSPVQSQSNGNTVPALDLPATEDTQGRFSDRDDDNNFGFKEPPSPRMLGICDFLYYII